MAPKNPALEYLNAVYRYPLVAVCTFVVGFVITAWTVRMLPDVFVSTTLIMVEPQDVPQAFVKSTVTTRLEERLNALNQEVLSRTRLEAIINDLGLFRDLNQKGVPREGIVEAMRKKIQINVFSRDNAFRISYEGNVPVTVQQVTSRLAGLYVDENLRIREEHVSGTAEFLEGELERAKRQIEQLDSKIQSFKQEHMGELPEQRETNMHTLDGLRVQLQTVSLALSAAKERKQLRERAAAEARTTRPANPGQSSALSTDPHVRLGELETQLADLRTRYKGEHPDVMAAQRKIAQLRADLKATTGNEKATADPLLPPELRRSLDDLSVEIARLTVEQENTEKALSVYQARIEATFTREQQLLSITRDYDVTQKEYQSMLDKKLDAQLSQSLERRQKGERFRVLDPANLPESPSRPNRTLLGLGGLAGSLGLAILLPILLWQLDTSYHQPEDLEAHAVPVLAVIPQVYSADTARRLLRYRLRVLALSALGLVVGLGTVSVYAEYMF